MQFQEMFRPRNKCPIFESDILSTAVSVCGWFQPKEGDADLSDAFAVLVVPSFMMYEMRIWNNKQIIKKRQAN